MIINIIIMALNYTYNFQLIQLYFQF